MPENGLVRISTVFNHTRLPCFHGEQWVSMAEVLALILAGVYNKPNYIPYLNSSCTFRGVEAGTFDATLILLLERCRARSNQQMVLVVPLWTPFIMKIEPRLRLPIDYHAVLSWTMVWPVILIGTSLRHEERSDPVWKADIVFCDCQTHNSCNR